MAMDLHGDTPDYILRSHNYAEKGAKITICRYIIYWIFSEYIVEDPE